MIAGFLTGLLLGDRRDVLNDTLENFKNSNLLHILALSGLHIVYVSFGVRFLLDLIISRERLKNIIMIFFLIFFSVFTGGSPSCIRACIMCSMTVLSKIIYRKNDFLTSLLFSLDIILVLNCYNIESVGMWLSFLATFGLVYIRFDKGVLNEKLTFWIRLKSKFFTSIKTSFACNIMILPIIWNTYNTVSLTFFVSNFFASFLIGPIIILGYINLFLGKLGLHIIEKFLIEILFKLAEIIGNFKISKIYVPSILVIFWVIYYLVILGIIYFRENKKYLKVFLKFLKDKIKFLIYVTFFIIIFFCLIFYEKQNLEIHFLDVGQGDCTLIITPENRKILIDGGNNEGYDNGENVVAPYLLKNGITKIDYVIISHGDSDHIGGLFFILENLNVKNVIVSFQNEKYENIDKLIKIATKEKINLMIVNKGDKIKIENGLYFDVLWPDRKKFISENGINNNSLVLKLNYNSFSCLFTGDIEEIAEKKILQEYKDNEKILNSTILKVAHHGSKTSSIEEFIEKVKPKIALIGVGENNNFGHPNSDVLERIKDARLPNF